MPQQNATEENAANAKTHSKDAYPAKQDAKDYGDRKNENCLHRSMLKKEFCKKFHIHHFFTYKRQI